MVKTLTIDHCEACKCLDDGDAYDSQFYCNHADAPRDENGKYRCFDAADGIPEWCPLKDGGGLMSNDKEKKGDHKVYIIGPTSEGEPAWGVLYQGDDYEKALETFTTFQYDEGDTTLRWDWVRSH